METIDIRELKSRLSHYVAIARKGEHVTIANRGKEVAIIVPSGRGDVERKLKHTVKEGAVSWSVRKPSGLGCPCQSEGSPLLRSSLSTGLDPLPRHKLLGQALRGGGRVQ